MSADRVEYLEVAGAPVFVERSRDIPLVAATVTSRSGSATDPAGLEGRAHHLAELALRGAGGRDRAAVDAAFDRLGTGVSVQCSRDSFGYTVTCLRRHLDAVCALLGDVLARPGFAPAEHRKLVRETVADIEELRDDDAELASRYFARYFAPGHPYSRPLDGSRESLERLGQAPAADLAATYRGHVAAENLVLGFAGDLDDGSAEALAGRLLAPIAGSAPAPIELPDPPLEPRRRCYLIDKPERTQTQILLGHRGPAYGTADAVAMLLIEAAFGGMFSSRLMQEVRVKRGWSYGAGLRLARSRGSHWLRMSLAPSIDVAAEALGLVIELYEELRADGLGDDEIDLARRYVAGGIALNRATPRQRIQQATAACTFGLPRAFNASLAGRVEALSRAEVTAAIERTIHPESLTTVVVGTAALLEERLAQLPVGEVVVVPYREY